MTWTLLLLAACGTPEDPSDGTTDTDIIDEPDTDLPVPWEDVSDDLKKVRRHHDLPALSAGAFRAGVVERLGAVGHRAEGHPEEVTPWDRYHLGSDTKAMTATLYALLVEDGVLGWETTVTEAFPDLEVDPGFADLPLVQLLRHRGGIDDGAISQSAWVKVMAHPSLVAQRAELTALLLTEPPPLTPNEDFFYSNLGYVIVGSAMERATGEAWEDLMRARIFGPLAMDSCGFGTPATPGTVDQPWGHIVQGDTLVPIEPGPTGDNPAAIGPAGTVHCALDDWADFLTMHVAGARGEPTVLLDPDAFARLHTPLEGQDYAMGWLVTQRTWAGGTVLVHDGTNTTFYSIAWLAPAIDAGFFGVTNVADTRGPAGMDEAIGVLIEQTLAN